jgi:hypothetical protein
VRFSVVADAWARSIEARRKPRTVEGYRHLLDLHVRPTFGGQTVGSITYADVDAFVRLLETGHRPGTTRNAFYVLKMVLDYAVRDGQLRSKPVPRSRAALGALTRDAVPDGRRGATPGRCS